MNLMTKIFTEALLNWYWQHGRQNLPWQNPYDPYRVWISEIMLQQTQVKTVIPYFLNFMKQFPSIQALAQASLDDVLAAWSGLGYYSRARNLYRTAQIIVTTQQGVFPQDTQALQTLPGIGRSTAAAIASLAFEQPSAILDGNVKRVLSRYFKVAGTDRNYEKQLWELAQSCMSQTDCRAYTQAIMDLGALCCTPTQPQCKICPLRSHCQALQANVVADYPEKKPKKIRPTRHEKFLVLYHDQHIYLEQRPLEGIWGGLWCLPTIDSDTDLLAYLQIKYGITLPSIQPFMLYKHSFTHFHLHINAYAAKTESQHLGSGQWFAFSELTQLGLSKPVKDIVKHFMEKF